MVKDDSDVKKYRPQKNGFSKSPLNDFNIEAGTSFMQEMSDQVKDLRRREENYLFRDYGTMMDTSEVIDFADGE